MPWNEDASDERRESTGIEGRHAVGVRTENMSVIERRLRRCVERNEIKTTPFREDYSFDCNGKMHQPKWRAIYLRWRMSTT